MIGTYSVSLLATLQDEGYGDIVEVIDLTFKVKDVLSTGFDDTLGRQYGQIDNAFWSYLPDVTNRA